MHAATGCHILVNNDVLHSSNKGVMTMKGKSLVALGAALLLSTSAGSAADLVIYHGWSSPAEVAALNILKSGLEAGAKRTDAA